MKKLVILVVLAIFIASPVCAGMADDKWTGEDKTLHLAAGSLIGAAITSHCTINGKMVWWKSVLIGTGAAAIVGTIKEIMDSDDSGFSYKDLTWTVGGGVVGSIGAVAFWTCDGRFKNWKFAK